MFEKADVRTKDLASSAAGKKPGFRIVQFGQPAGAIADSYRKDTGDLVDRFT